MSAQDAVSSAKDIVERAARWGHKAIAITDHGVVQAFPDAEKAAKKCGIKLIYGVEAYMFDDTRKIYDYADDLDFSDEYVVFDIETTGLNPNTCEITEIGAVKLKDGKVTGRFHTFVKTSAPIPPP
jgi:DNA polymerase-3 subunit alpha (Gram-positive type)